MTHLAALSDLDLRSAHMAAQATADEPLAAAIWAIFVSRHSLNERGYRDPIVTYHALPPIPVRDFDWQAHRDSDEGGEGLSGWGRTEAAAIADLVELERERDEDIADHEAALHAEQMACEAEWRAEYERDEAADDRRNARRDDPFERWPDEIG